MKPRSAENAPMNVSLRVFLLFLAAAAGSAAACGGNVIVDELPPGTGGTPTTVATHAATGVGGGVAVSGVTVGSGAGGAPFTAAAVTGVTVTTTATTGGGLGGSGGAGGAPCDDGLDDKILVTTDIFPGAVKCVMEFLGQEPALTSCLASVTGLTAGCVACVDADLRCSAASCLSECLGDQASAACANCRVENCGKSFVACSGRAHEPGTLRCADVFGGGPQMTPWQRGLDASDFVTTAALQDYDALDACACKPGKCLNLCANFYCLGLVGPTACAQCIETQCTPQVTSCQAD